jgi:hypothetical protein
MIRPERDPHWCLGREHGAAGREPYTFADAENQRRYLAGYAAGRVQRAAVLDCGAGGLGAQTLQGGGLPPSPSLADMLRPGTKWRP